MFFMDLYDKDRSLDSKSKVISMDLKGSGMGSCPTYWRLVILYFSADFCWKWWKFAHILKKKFLLGGGHWVIFCIHRLIQLSHRILQPRRKNVTDDIQRCWFRQQILSSFGPDVEVEQLVSQLAFDWNLAKNGEIGRGKKRCSLSTMADATM